MYIWGKFKYPFKPNLKNLNNMKTLILALGASLCVTSLTYAQKPLPVPAQKAPAQQKDSPRLEQIKKNIS